MQTVPSVHKSFRRQRCQQPRERDTRVFPFPLAEARAATAPAEFFPGATLRQFVSQHVGFARRSVRVGSEVQLERWCLTAVYDPRGPRGNVSPKLYKKK